MKQCSQKQAERWKRFPSGSAAQRERNGKCLPSVGTQSFSSETLEDWSLCCLPIGQWLGPSKSTVTEIDKENSPTEPPPHTHTNTHSDTTKPSCAFSSLKPGLWVSNKDTSRNMLRQTKHRKQLIRVMSSEGGHLLMGHVLQGAGHPPIRRLRSPFMWHSLFCVVLTVRLNKCQYFALIWILIWWPDSWQTEI